MKTIAIIGSLAVGKSTLSEKISKMYKNGILYSEPFDKIGFLPEFYKDPKKYGFAVQIGMLSHRFELHKQGVKEALLNDKTVVYDGIYTLDSAYCNTNYNLGNIEKHELETYNALLNVMDMEVVPCNIVFLLHTTTEVIMSRIKERNRDFEKDIKPEYIEELQKQMFKTAYEERKKGSRVYNIDYTDFEKAEKEIIEILKRYDKVGDLIVEEGL